MDTHLIHIDQEELVALRREIHQNPELKWDLPATRDLICRELDKIGLNYEADKYGPCSVVAMINAEKPGFTIALRADMDALPIHEANEDKPYR
ncbi:MAG: amidohydrolase, partial [Clostridia bacterium]|nr:amidohydrolase [Clostridia bacterium]